jgi:hypothetical protein
MASASTSPGHPESDHLRAIMTAFFAAVSFPDGDRPHYDHVLPLFLPGALLVRCGPGEPEALPVRDFVSQRQAAFTAGGLTSFEEHEVEARDDVFGGVAQRFSAYGKSGTRLGVPFTATGWISTQFARLPSGWRISGMAWDDAPQ